MPSFLLYCSFAVAKGVSGRGECWFLGTERGMECPRGRWDQARERRVEIAWVLRDYLEQVFALGLSAGEMT